jgi:hypothetical protein
MTAVHNESVALRRGIPLTHLQLKALKLIAQAGEEGLDFYWYPAKGHKVLIHAGTEGSLCRLRLITMEWRHKAMSDGALSSVKVAKLTQAGWRALDSGYLPRL